jgi:hypothetical protein
MLSRITIALDFENGNQPVIKIQHYPQSDDLRDSLIGAFFEKLNGSTICTINRIDNIPEGSQKFNSYNTWVINPLPMELGVAPLARSKISGFLAP